jgi:recombination protein RecA
MEMHQQWSIGGGDMKDYSKDLIKDINKELGTSTMFNLGDGNAPTVVHRWVSTGSKQLDYIIGNIPTIGGGLPEGRIIELQGPTGGGKSHIAALAARSCQSMNGLVVYIDTENATSPENLARLGVDVKKNFAFAQCACTEDVFKIIESTILKARQITADIPILVVWDSVANTSPKAELEGEYDQNTIGLQARVLGKGFRKITNIIANQHVILLCLQQQREKIGVLYGDPSTTPGGKALPYNASIRIKLGGGGQIKKTVDGEERVVGVSVTANVIKNRMSAPFRKVDFEIHFGKGIKEYEQVFDYLRTWCDKHADSPAKLDNNKIVISGTGAWKEFSISDITTGEVLKSIKFYKDEFGGKILYNPEYKKEMVALMNAAYLWTSDEEEHLTLGEIVPEEAAEELTAE